jgi:hypothetical protein
VRDGLPFSGEQNPYIVTTKPITSIDRSLDEKASLILLVLLYEPKLKEAIFCMLKITGHVN